MERLLRNFPLREESVRDAPYLPIFLSFVLNVSHGIHNAITAGKWHPIMLSRNGIPLSHLFFADDLFLFAEATVEQAQVISAVLANFCTCSDAKINANKTLLFFFKNMGDTDISRISGFLGFLVTSDLGKYLGVPLHHSRVSSSMFQNIVDKVEKRLSG